MSAQRENRRRRRPKPDPFRELMEQAGIPYVGEYRPLVGYLYSDGSVVRFSSDQMAWYSFDRCVSACFGSAAKRLRGTWDAAVNTRGVIVAFLMMVFDGRSRIVWKQRIDIPRVLPS